MKLLDIQIDGFGKLTSRHIVFGDGTNVVYGKNEAGKSTLHTLIRSMLFGMKRARGVAAQTDTWSHYKPWSGAPYRATMRVTYNGHTYRITRDFDEDPIGAVIYDESTGISVADTLGWFREVLGGISESAYDNSISIGQLKSASDESMAQELKSFILNMDSTGNKNLNADNAKAYLRMQREYYESQLIPDTGKAINTNLAEINRLEKEMEDSQYISKIRELSDEIKKLSGTTDGEDYLKQNRFDGSKDIDEYSGKVRNAYNEYKAEETAGKGKRSKTPVIIFAVILLLAIAAGIYCYTKNLQGLLYVCVAVGAVAAILLIIFEARRSKAEKIFNQKKTQASELLTRLTANAEVSDDNLSKAKERITILKNVALATEGRQTQYKIQDELMTKIERLRFLRKQNEQLKEAQKINKEAEYNIQAIDIALETIDELSATLKDSFGLYLNKEASEYIRAITGGIYTSMSIGDDLNVYMNTRDKMVPIEQVSSGTSDQIYLAVRLACAKLMQGDTELLPLIFDDSFVNYDEARLAAALTWIVKAYGGQIIIFSCHTREAELLNSNNIRFNEIIL